MAWSNEDVTKVYPLSFALAIWAVRYSIRKHVNFNPRYVSLDYLHEKSFLVVQPELKENNIVDLQKFREKKINSHSQTFSRH